MRTRWLFMFIIIAALIPSVAYATTVFNLDINLGSCASGGVTNCNENPSAGFFSSIACRIMKTFNAGITPLYCNIINNPVFTSALNGAMVLFVTLSGLMYAGGIIRASKGDFILRLLKITFIYALVTNADIYMNVIFNTVLILPQEIISVVLRDGTAADGAPQNIFEYVDKGISLLFQEVVPNEPQAAANQSFSGVDMRLMVLGLVIAKALPGGEFIAFIFFGVICGWLFTYLTVMVRILISLMAIMFLLVLGPLFIPTLLFKATANFGGEWIKMLTSFVIQMVMVVMFLVMIESFFIEFFDMIKVGFSKITLDKGFSPYIQPFAPDIDTVQNNSGITSTGAQQYLTTLNGPMAEWLPRFFFDLLVMLVIIFATKSFLSAIPNIATSISGSNRLSVMGGDFNGPRMTSMGLPGSDSLSKTVNKIGR